MYFKLYADSYIRCLRILGEFLMVDVCCVREHYRQIDPKRFCLNCTPHTHTLGLRYYAYTRAHITYIRWPALRLYW